MDHPHWTLWIAFWATVGIMLTLDLFFFNKKAKAISLRAALSFSIVCIALAMLFFGGVYAVLGAGPAISWLTAYLVEESLSVDNLFVFLIIFRAFHVAETHWHRVLFWGVIGAIILRFLLIFGGISLVQRFHWMLYFFGALLVYMGIKLAIAKEAPPKDPGSNPAVALIRKWLPITDSFHGGAFFVGKGKSLKATPLFLVLVTVEFSDLIFAVDSIPAVLGISQDFFIILTSNVFAILGLRALFFVLSNLANRFHYLQSAIALILGFIGVKMLIAPWVDISDVLSLGIVIGTLALAAMASIFRPQSP